MKLGYVLKIFPRLSETFILNELLGLERLGCEITIFSRYRPTEAVPHEALRRLRAEVVHLEELLEQRFWEPFDIHRRLSARDPRRHEQALDEALAWRSRQEMRYWLLAGAVALGALERGLELLHAHFATGSASVAAYAARLSGLPFTFTAHAKDIYANTVDRRRLRWLIETAAAAITVSEANAAFLRALAPEGRIVRVYNGLDLERIAPLPEPPRPDPPLLLSVARFVEKKGLVHLLEATAHLRRAGLPVRCRLVGEGPLEPVLRERARELGIAEGVELPGPASQEAIVGEHLPRASVFVLPCVVASDGDRDGLPTTLLEAMARGVPVVSTSLPGIEEALPDGRAGWLAPPGDAAALAALVRRCLEDTEGTRQRARWAREHVERHFDARRNTAQLLATLREARRVEATP